MAQTNVVKMSGSLKVKAMLLQSQGMKKGSSPEVRRFTISDVTYNGLLTSVQSAFSTDSSQHQQHYTLSWKDEDGDLVLFSSTDELHHALHYMADDTLRLYVTISRDDTHGEETATKASDTTQHDSGPVHYPHPYHWQWMGAGPPPVVMGPDMHSGRKGGMMKRKCRHKESNGKNEEFKTVREQVPAEFRFWVRQYVRTWFLQGAEAANQIDKLPNGAPSQFRQWLHDCLTNWSQRNAGKANSGSDGETRMDGVEDEEKDMLAAPDGLPPVYYHWFRLFLPRFHQNKISKNIRSHDCEEGHQSPVAGHGRHGKHAGCHGKKGEKRGEHFSSTSESEDTDGGEKMWKKVPKEFRKYVRVTVKKLHKDKVDTSKAKQKANEAGLSMEVVDFVPRILLEWHAKLSQKRPHAVATEMMEAERTLPSGLEREHFLWMCRFMARWHRRHAGKCDSMAGWSSGDTGDDTSGEEGIGPCPQGHFRTAMRAMRRQQRGRMGPPFHPFMMHSGMGPRSRCFPPPPPGMPCWAPPCCTPGGRRSSGDTPDCNGAPALWPCGPYGGAKRCCRKNKSQRCARPKDQDGASPDQVYPHYDKAVENVTSGVKKM